MKTSIKFSLISRVLIVMLGTGVFSCSSSEEPDPQQMPLRVPNGFLAAIIDAQQDLNPEPIRKDLWGYKDIPSFRGYVVVPSKRLRVTHIGGMIARPGEYPFDIFEREEFTFTDTLMINQPLIITKTNSFQYQEVTEEIILEPNKQYIFRYYNPDHSSVYDVFVPLTIQREYEEQETTPWKNKDVTMQGLHYFYTFPVFPYEGTREHGYVTTIGKIRGLVDFKYQVVE